MLSHAVPAVVGPQAGVVLDCFDRKRIMTTSDLVRAVIALSFCADRASPPIVRPLRTECLLMFASPFSTSGRTAILPAITDRTELHTANSLTQHVSSGQSAL